VWSGVHAKVLLALLQLTQRLVKHHPSMLNTCTMKDSDVLG
jgi:hypothetical protein